MNRTFDVYSQEEVDKWVLTMYNTYVYDSANCIVKAITNCKYRYTICCNLKTGNVSKSKCHSEDKYDARIGIAYAYARLENLPEPKLVEKTYRLDECVGKTVVVDGVSYYAIGCESNKNHVVVEKLSDHSLLWLYSWDKVKESDIKE